MYEVVKPKGYIRHFDRDCCWNCRFYYNNTGRVPKQEVKSVCNKVEPEFEIYDDDVCDEFERLK